MSTPGPAQPAPRAVPDLGDVSAASVSPGVSDDDRNRYGVLLDRAAERGLLAPLEYQARLAELADAGSEEELRRIVTELPAFGVPPGAPGARGTAAVPGAAVAPAVRRVPGPVTVPDGAALDSALWANLTPTRTRRTSANPWLLLGFVVVMLLLAMVALALVAAHVVHTRPTGLPAPGAVGAVLSRLRP